LEQIHGGAAGAGCVWLTSFGAGLVFWIWSCVELSQTPPLSARHLNLNRLSKRQLKDLTAPHGNLKGIYGSAQHRSKACSLTGTNGLKHRIAPWQLKRIVLMALIILQSSTSPLLNFKAPHCILCLGSACLPHG
jgi:hypothetical protein